MRPTVTNTPNTLYVSVCVCVCRSQPWAVLKRLNRSRCRLGCGLGWAKESRVRWGPNLPQGNWQFWGEPACDAGIRRNSLTTGWVMWIGLYAWSERVAGSEMDMGWVHPWVGLGWVRLGWVAFSSACDGLSWVEWEVLLFFHCILCLL